MLIYMKKLIIKNKIVKNASWIIFAKIIQSVLSLIISTLTARFLGPSNYGLVTYASALATFVVPIMNLGLTEILVQQTVDEPELEGKIYGTAIILNLISSVFCIIGIFSFTLIANAGEKETTIVCVLYSTILIFQAIETIQYWFQSKLLSKYTSFISLIAYFIISMYKIFLLATGKSIRWFAVSNALDYLMISFAGIVFYKKLGGQKLSFSWELGKHMLKRSRYYIISGMMVNIFALTDRIMLKLMIDDAASGYYSVAVTCAGMVGFVFPAIINSVRPSIFESKNKGKELFEKKIIQLYSVIIYLSLLQCVGITLFANIIINILYGVQYTDSILALRIIVWYTSFSYMGAVRNIWILSEEKQKYLWIINLSGACMNVVLNLLLIPRFGIYGAAGASLITQIFTNVIVGYIIRPISKSNDLMIKSLNPMYLLGLLKSVRKDN